MPVSRAILIDLVTKGLSMNKPYTMLDKAGHIIEKRESLADESVVAQAEQPVIDDVAEQPVIDDTVTLAVQELIVEEQACVTQHHQEVVEDASLPVVEAPLPLQEVKVEPQTGSEFDVIGTWEAPVSDDNAEQHIVDVPQAQPVAESHVDTAQPKQRRRFKTRSSS